MALDTFVQRASRAFTAPPADAPRAIDLSSDLFAHFHYDDLPSISSGAEYSSWESRVGSHALVPISGLGAPTRQPSSLGGKGAVAFDYNDSSSTPYKGLQTAPGAAWTLDAASTGVTFAVVAYNRSNKSAGGNPSSRLLASRSSSEHYTMGSTSGSYAGIGLMTGSGGTGAMYTPADNSMDGRWFVAVGVITAGETRLYVDDLPTLAGSGAGSGTSYGFRMGVNSAGVSPFTGFLRETRVYKKAYSAVEAKALIAALRFEHLGIAN